MKLHIVLVIHDNSIIHSEPFCSLSDTQHAAVMLANEWYRKDGIESFGKYQLETFDEMQKYYRSDAYLDSGDAAHICIEEVSAINSSCYCDIKAFPAVI